MNTYPYTSYGADRLLTYTALGRELERNARSQEMADETRSKDLDETRRLLYMALLMPRTERYELAGTLVHALVHHQQVAEPVEQVIENVLAGIEGEPDAQLWLRTQIDRVTDELH
jgi:hypothetical protein